MQFLVGANDELFHVDKFESAIRPYRGDVPVTIVPGINHIGMTLDPKALAAIVAAIRP